MKSPSGRSCSCRAFIPAARESGSTLSELLIAMALGLTVLAGIYSFYVTSVPIYTLQEQLLETHQNLRIALELLVEDIQQTGGAGIPLTAAVNVTNSSTKADSLRVLLSRSVCDPPKPQVIPIDTYEGAAATMFLAQGTTCAAMDGKIAVAVTADGIQHRTLQITQVTTANDKINFSPGLSPMNSPQGLAADYTGGTLVLVDQVDYSVDVSDPAKPILRRNQNTGAGAQPLALYIEDMQVSLGYDKNGDGVLFRSGEAADDDEWIFNVPGESVASEAPTHLRAVDVVLVGRTRRPDPRFKGARPAVMDRAPGGADGYHRRIRGTRAQIRNLSR